MHEIACDIARVSKELGKIPLRDEYLLHGVFSRKTIDSVGGYTVAIHASGIKYTAHQTYDKQDIRKKLFELTKKESEERNPLLEIKKSYNHILAISDLHCPVQHPDAIDFIIALNRKYNFDLVINLGDEVNLNALSFHDKNPDEPSAGYELELAIKSLQPLYKEFPKMMLCESNHGSLVYRKGLHHGFPRHVLKSYREVLMAPEGWTWHNEIIVESHGSKILFCHGYSSNALLASQKRAMSYVAGHYHTRFSVQHWSNTNGIFFAAQAGCLIHDKHQAFLYNKLIIERPILGLIRIENGEPKLIPMQLNEKGRWNGKIP